MDGQTYRMDIKTHFKYKRAFIFLFFETQTFGKQMQFKERIHSNVMNINENIN